MFEILEYKPLPETLQVIGIGGGGVSAINYMIEQGMQGAEFIAIDTNAETLSRSLALTQLLIGTAIIEDMGGHSEPSACNAAAEEFCERIKASICNADMVFIIAGMGGRTEQEIAPMVAQIARELKILTVAIITNQFSHESDRHHYDDVCIKSLSANVDSLIIVPKIKISGEPGNDEAMQESYTAACKFMHSAVTSLVTALTDDCFISVDFADLSIILSDSGIAIFGTGSASGTNRAQIAAERAISCLQFENRELTNTRGALVNITHDSYFTMQEYKEVMRHVRSIVSEESTVIVCAYPNRSTSNELHVAVFATGFNLI